MNNYINFARKMARNRLERATISDINKVVPNVEQYIGSSRYPVMPKIVVYSAAANAGSFLEKYNLPKLGSSPSTTSSRLPSAPKLTKSSPDKSLTS